MQLQNFALERLEEFTPKLRLAKILDISTKTLYEYHDIAMLIGDFELDYPAFTANSSVLTKVPLTKYQCWVIFALILACRRLPRASVEECLREDLNPQFTNKFTKKYFVENAGEFNHEYQGICKVA